MKSYMFLAVVALLMVCFSGVMAQQVTTIHITAAVTATPLAVTGGTLDFANLAVGQNYKAPADITASTAGIFPQTANGETVAFGETTIAGDPQANVIVTFGLPNALYPTGGGLGQVSLSYDASSAAWGIAGAEDHFFDPRSPIVIPLLADGSGNIVLSANPSVSSKASVDTYEGDALITVSYTGE